MDSGEMRLVCSGVRQAAWGAGSATGAPLGPFQAVRSIHLSGTDRHNKTAVPLHAACLFDPTSVARKAARLEPALTGGERRGTRRGRRIKTTLPTSTQGGGQ